MPGPFVPFEIRAHAGGAIPAKLNTTMAIDALSFTLQAGQGASYPDGSTGPFNVSVDAGAAGMEHMRGASRSGDTVNINSLADRGLMGTTRLQHQQGAAVTHGWTSTESDEAIATAHYTLGQITQRGDMLYADSSGTMAAFPKGSAGQSPVYQADSSVAAGNPTPGPHTHNVSDIIGINPGLLARQRHSFGGSSVTTINGGSTTAHAFDTTNATLTFVAPASGDVIVKFAGVVTTSQPTMGASMTPVMVTHGTSTVVSTVPLGGFGAIQGLGLEASGGQGLVWSDLITGLTAGNTYSWDFGAVVGTSSVNVTIVESMLECWAA